MKQKLFVIIGIVLSIIISVAGVFFILNPIQQETGSSPESLMHYAYFIIYPVSIFIGSLLTGYLIGHNIEKRKIKNILYLPGFYISIPYVFSIFMASMLSIFMFIAVLANILTSFLGVYFGVKLKQN